MPEYAFDEAEVRAELLEALNPTARRGFWPSDATRRSTADLRTHVGSFGSLAPPKVWFSLLQRSPLFTTSIVLSRSELV